MEPLVIKPQRRADKEENVTVLGGEHSVSLRSDQHKFNSTMDPINDRQTENVDVGVNPELRSIQSVLALRWTMESRVKEEDGV